MSDATLMDGLGRILHRDDVNGSALNGTGPLLTRRFSIFFKGGTVLDALNALVRANQSAWWQAFVPESKKKISVCVAVAPGFRLDLDAPVSQIATTTAK